MTATVLRALAAGILDGRDGERSASAGGDSYDYIFLAGFLFRHFALAEFAGIFVASDRRCQSFGASGDDELHGFGSVLKVGGHSAASRAAMRPLVPAPT